MSLLHPSRGGASTPTPLAAHPSYRSQSMSVSHPVTPIVRFGMHELIALVFFGYNISTGLLGWSGIISWN